MSPLILLNTMMFRHELWMFWIVEDLTSCNWIISMVTVVEILSGAVQQTFLKGFFDTLGGLLIKDCQKLEIFSFQSEFLRPEVNWIFLKMIILSDNPIRKTFINSVLYTVTENEFHTLSK